MDRVFHCAYGDDDNDGDGDGDGDGKIPWVILLHNLRVLLHRE